MRVKTEDKRDAIVRAASEVFGDMGFEGASRRNRCSSRFSSPSAETKSSVEIDGTADGVINVCARNRAALRAGVDSEFGFMRKRAAVDRQTATLARPGTSASLGPRRLAVSIRRVHALVG